MPARALMIADWPETIALSIADCAPDNAVDRASLPALLRRASPRRRAEFLAGRECAKHALHRSGCAQSGQLPIGIDRMPIWPAGYTGSISHSDGLAMAAVSPAGAFAAIGIDIQQRIDDEKARRISAQIARDTEWARLPQDSATLIWCCKESFYKAWSKRIDAGIGFLDIQIVALDVQAGCADLRLGDTHRSLVHFTTFGEHSVALCTIAP